MNRQIYIHLLCIVALTSCQLAPGMRFNEASNTVDGTTKIVNASGLQYRLRLIPLTKKILYLQNYTKANLAVATNVGYGNNSIYSSTYAYRVQPSDDLGITMWESRDTVLPSSIRSAEEDIARFEFDARNEYGRSSSESIVSVDVEGLIYFPFAGEVYVKGLTVSEIRRKMQQKMREYFDDPKVSVRVLEHNSQFVLVTGQVGSPGRVPVASTPVTIVDAINLSGGLSEKGSWKLATLSRLNGEKFNIDLHKLYAEGDLSQNYRLRHGDILHIPLVEGQTAYLYKDGLAKPMLLQNNTVSLTEAIGNAGGIGTGIANAKAIFVLRRETGRPFGEVTAYHLNAKSPAALVLANSFFLKPKDIVYIETSNVVRWNRVASLITPNLGLPSTLVNLENTLSNN